MIIDRKYYNYIPYKSIKINLKQYLKFYYNKNKNNNNNNQNSIICFYCL